MSGEQIRVEGLAKLQADLKRISVELPAEIKAVGRESAELVAAEMRSRAPVGKDKHPGRLRGTIRPGATLKAAYVFVGNKLTPYAKPIVFGWRKRNIKPNPFPYTALDVRRAEVIERYRKSVRKITDSVHS